MQMDDSKNNLWDKDINTIISDIKEKIKTINEAERKKMQTVQVIPIENIIMGEEVSKPQEAGNQNTCVPFNVLLRRQQQMDRRKSHMINPLALENRARELLKANTETKLVDEDMEERLARSKADRYYKIADSDNLYNDLEIKTFQKAWGRLDTHLKINRLMKYAEKLQVDYKLNENSFKDLRITLIDAVNNRKITRKNDVQYNETLGEIMDIKGLTFNHDTCLFTYDPLNTKSKTKTAENEVNPTNSTATTTTVSNKPKIIIKTKPIAGVADGIDGIDELETQPQIEISKLQSGELELIAKKKQALKLFDQKPK
jgi:hypothetical protein